MNVDIADSGIVRSDLEIVTIIIRNLVSNAIKFTPQNGNITIKAFENQVIIKDSGIGMSQPMISDIVNNLYTSRKGTNDEHGKGMGLQLVLNLAEKINCKLAIKSEEFSGTEVLLIFENR